VSTTLKIVITKSIIEQSKYCGTNGDADAIGSSCAVATALIDIFPYVYVTGHHIFPFGRAYENMQNVSIPLPLIAQQFIKLFDGFSFAPKLRLLLPEFEFTIDIPDEVIDQINIEDIQALTRGDRKTPAGNLFHGPCLQEFPSF
jgi:hypothetical protein